MGEISDLIGGFIERTTFKTLKQRGVVTDDYIRWTKANGETVLRFKTLKDALNFRQRFLADYLQADERGVEAKSTIVLTGIGSLYNDAHDQNRLRLPIPPNADYEAWVVLPIHLDEHSKSYLRSINLLV